MVFLIKSRIPYALYGQVRVKSCGGKAEVDSGALEKNHGQIG